MRLRAAVHEPWVTFLILDTSQALVYLSIGTRLELIPSSFSLVSKFLVVGTACNEMLMGACYS